MRHSAARAVHGSVRGGAAPAASRDTHGGRQAHACCGRHPHLLTFVRGARAATRSGASSPRFVCSLFSRRFKKL
jgi:hypothetical protein